MPVPDPVRKEGEVLIDVHAAAVNRADLMQKDGCYASPPDWPQWCGLEVSGEVGALHDAGHGGEDHGEHRAERGGRQRRRKEVLFEGGEGESREKTAVTELLGMRRRERERERT